VVGLVNPRYFKMGVKSIRERSIRSWLTIFGIIISIAVILTLFSLSNGVSNEQKLCKLIGSFYFEPINYICL